MVVPIYVGFDSREAAAYHVFTQSVIDYASKPVAFIPLHRGMLDNFDGQRDGTNAFIFSRFLVPHLMGFDGWAIFVDGDMVVTEDIMKLYDQRDDYFAVQLVKHHYETAHPRKYIGTPLENDNIDYPRKNWSSVILWNCGHRSNHILTRKFVEDATGQFLHRFEWLAEDEIGSLDSGWNHLVGEYPSGPASLYHYTLGVPGISYYEDCDAADKWHQTLRRALHISGEKPSRMVKRAEGHK